MDTNDIQGIGANYDEALSEIDFFLPLDELPKETTHIVVDGPQPTVNAQGDEAPTWYVFACDDDGEPHADEIYFTRWGAVERGEYIGEINNMEVVIEAGFA